MKLIGLIVNVNQEFNRALVGDIVILNAEFVSSGDYELCYEEYDHDRRFSFNRIWHMFNKQHSVANIEIIGVL